MAAHGRRNPTVNEWAREIEKFIINRREKGLV
jgi:hypothetical protein